MSVYLGLIGKNGAGKTAVCDYLAQKGFAVYSLSDMVREEAANQGLLNTRENLIQVGNALKTKFGQVVLAERSYQKALQNQENTFKIVFDSIRNLAEVLFLKGHGVRMIGVDAPIELRFTRIQERKRESDRIDFATFVHHDELENSGKSSGQNISQCLPECELIFQNTGDLAALYNQIDTLLLSI